LSIFVGLSGFWGLINLLGKEGKTKNLPTPRYVPVFVKVHPEADMPTPGHVTMLNSLINEKSQGTEHGHFKKKGEKSNQSIFWVRFTLTAREGGPTF
jgi:hypothetical protein